MKVAIRQYALSLAVFVIVLGGIVSVDERVRDRVSALVHGKESVAPWGDRVSDLGSVLLMAVRQQSTENVSLVIFAVVGGVLFLFMFRT
jgi:hypothetical protein